MQQRQPQVGDVALRHDGLAHFWARRATGGAASFEDVLQDARVGLLEACHRFDESHGVRFSTYASYWIRRSIQRSASRARSAPTPPEHTDALRRQVRQLTQTLRSPQRPEPPTIEAVAAATGHSTDAIRAVWVTPIQVELDALPDLVDESATADFDAVLDRILARQALGEVDGSGAAYATRRFGLDGGPPASQREMARLRRVGRRQVRREEQEVMSLMRSSVGRI